MEGLWASLRLHARPLEGIMIRSSLSLSDSYCTVPKCPPMQAQELQVSEDGEYECGEAEGKSLPTRTRLKPCKKDAQAKPGLSKTKQKKLAREEQERQQKTMIMAAFHAFYEAQYGERWPSLSSALNAKPRTACLVNKFADMGVFAENMKGVANLKRVPFVSVPLYDCNDMFPHPERDERNVYTSYLLDAASVLATEALELSPEDRVLDLCAAPGGKAVSILQHLQFPSGSLTANELSADRRRRLWKVVMDYLPKDCRQYVSVTGRDGTQWSQPDSFTKVLVDAPCSSERHLLQNYEELCKWSDHRSVQCAKRQHALLNAALKNVCVGGLVVYSTCSISNYRTTK